MTSTTLSYLALANNLARTQAATANQPVVARETAYYRANIGKVTSADALIANTRLFNYVMKAFGLADMTYAKGLVRSVLAGGVSDSSSLANRLSDTRFKKLATTFDFVGKGAAATQTSAVTQDVVAQYAEQTLEDNQGQSNTGVQLALYFKRNASTVTNVYGILADKALYKVVKTIFGIPDSVSAQDIDVQAQTLSKYLKVADLQDSTKVDKLLQRFTASYDLQNGSTATPNAILASGTSNGIGADLLSALQSFRLGGT